MWARRVVWQHALRRVGARLGGCSGSVDCHTTTTTAAATTTMVAQCVSRRSVHAQPFSELAPDASKGEAYEAARDALLQLNLMVRNGIEPDALMYTSFIAVMARAKLEWQAYKLFSRMIEMHVRPLPETYVALLDATSPQRAKLREHIQAKMEEALELAPAQLAEDELARQRAADQQCVAKFDAYMRGTLPPLSSTAPSPSAADAHEHVTLAKATTTTTRDGDTRVESNKANDDDNSNKANDDDNSNNKDTAPNDGASTPVATMHIRHPVDAWHAAQLAEQVRGAAKARARGSAAAELRDALARLHDEELRIYLAAQRQLRHGNKEQLIARILEHVGEQAIRAMLQRRSRYFRAVGDLLQAELHACNADDNDVDDDDDTNTTTTKANDDNNNNNADGDDDTRTSATTAHAVARAADAARASATATLTRAERDDVSPEVLHAPWGVLRKPARRRAEPTAPQSAERLARVRLTADELLLVQHKAHTKALDELPDSLLRRYAFMFRLRWRRREPLSLLSAVEWHALTFLRCTSRDNDDNNIDNNNDERRTHEESSEVTVVTAAASVTTPALRLQKEDEGMQRTLANYDAFRVIAQRTNNLQVVDSAEVNLHIRRTRAAAAWRERVDADLQRREHNVRAAAALAAAARSYTLPPSPHDDDASGAAGHVLGLEHAHDPHRSSRRSTHTDNNNNNNNGDDAAGELPPWALTSGEDEFDLRSGRFGGDAALGRYRELSDSRVRLLPSREAQQRWAVDWQLLPPRLRETVQRAELAQQQQHDAVEREYAARMQHARYRKWDKLLATAQAKKAAARQRQREDAASDTTAAAAAGPLPPRRRYVSLLRKGVERQSVPDDVRARYAQRL